jgi:hypothetical protein
MRTRTWTIPIKQWFPSEDEIAILVVKLCILREDFLLELAGMIHGEKFSLESKPTYKSYKAGLDNNSEGWRRAYFYRNSLKTLFEMRGEVEAYFSSPKLSSALARESPRFLKVMTKLRSELQTAAKTVERIRHNLGGHISRGTIRKTLANMPTDVKGFLQAGEISGKTRYKYLAEIVLRMMLPGVPERELLTKLGNLFKETSQLTQVFGSIDDVVSIYVQDRGLYRRN